MLNEEPSFNIRVRIIADGIRPIIIISETIRLTNCQWNLFLLCAIPAENLTMDWPNRIKDIMALSKILGSRQNAGAVFS